MKERFTILKIGKKWKKEMEKRNNKKPYVLKKMAR
jgi:hypothetical protein